MQPHMRGGSQRLNVLENSDGGKLVGENRAAAAAPYLKLVLGRKRAKRESNALAALFEGAGWPARVCQLIQSYSTKQNTCVRASV